MNGLMSKLPVLHKPLATSGHSGYPSFGVPETTGQLWVLRTVWLQNMVNILGDPNVQHSFGHQAYARVKTWFSCMLQGPLAGNNDMGLEELQQPLLNPMPYIALFREYLLAWRHAVWQLQCGNMYIAAESFFPSFCWVGSHILLL